MGEYDFDWSVPFPPIDISNSFERQMYMANTLQNPDKTLEMEYNSRNCL